ncbi:hypothetical protein ACLOJK_016746 [Asimina triloba]
MVLNIPSLRQRIRPLHHPPHHQNAFSREQPNTQFFLSYPGSPTDTNSLPLDFRFPTRHTNMQFALIFTFFFLLLDGTKFILCAHGPSYYYDQCAPSICGSSLLRFPLGINALCSSAYITVSCENNSTVYVADDENPGIKYQILQTLNVSAYAQRSIRLVDISLFGCGPIPPFPGQGSQKWQMAGNFHMSTDYQTGTFFNCTQLPPADLLPNMRKVPCLECGGATANMCYFYDGYVDQIQNCLSSRLPIPMTMLNNNFSGITNLRRELEAGFVVDWDGSCAEACMDRTAGRCGFTDASDRNKGNELCFCSSGAHRQNCSDGMSVSVGNASAFSQQGKIATGQRRTRRVHRARKLFTASGGLTVCLALCFNGAYQHTQSLVMMN